MTEFMRLAGYDEIDISVFLKYFVHYNFLYTIVIVVLKKCISISKFECFVILNTISIILPVPTTAIHGPSQIIITTSAVISTTGS